MGELNPRLISPHGQTKALTKCKDCGHQISKSAKACPGCGAKIRRTSLFTWVVAVILGLIFLGTIIGGPDKEKGGNEDASKAATEEARLAVLTPEQRAMEEKRVADEAAAQEELNAQNIGLRWSYDNFDDKMGRGTIRTASVKSLNEVKFDFPYQGAQRAKLQLRVHPKYGKDVMLEIEKGQFLCSSYDGCNVSVRFDQGKPQTYAASEPEDNSTNLLFIDNYVRFLAKAQKSKKVFIEAKFYQEGTRVFEFDISNLKW